MGILLALIIHSFVLCLEKLVLVFVVKMDIVWVVFVTVSLGSSGRPATKPVP